MFAEHDRLASMLFDSVRTTLEMMAFSEVVLCGENGVVVPLAQPFEEQITPEPSDDSWGAINIDEALPSDISDDTMPEQVKDDDAWASHHAEQSPWEADVSAGGDWGAGNGNGAGAMGGFGNIPGMGDIVVFPGIADDALWASIDVHAADGTGTFLLEVDRLLTSELAETMYAGDVELNEGILEDLVAELANTIIGHLMLTMGEDAGSFLLEVPVKGCGAQNVAEDLPNIVCKCMVDARLPVRASLVPSAR